MHLHAIRSCTIVCKNLDEQLIAYQKLGFSLLSRQPLPPERGLELGLNGASYPSALLAMGDATTTCLELIEGNLTSEAWSWQALRVRVPDWDALIQNMPDGFRIVAQYPQSEGCDSCVLVQGPAGEMLYLYQRRSAQDLPYFAALIASQSPKLSAAFYLGLGARTQTKTLSEPAACGVQLESKHCLEFADEHHRGQLHAPGRATGIYVVTLARRGTRLQSGPTRILRGPDLELIELA